MDFFLSNIRQKRNLPHCSMSVRANFEDKIKWLICWPQAMFGVRNRSKYFGGPVCLGTMTPLPYLRTIGNQQSSGCFHVGLTCYNGVGINYRATHIPDTRCHTVKIKHSSGIWQYYRHAQAQIKIRNTLAGAMTNLLFPDVVNKWDCSRGKWVAIQISLQRYDKRCCNI